MLVPFQSMVDGSNEDDDKSSNGSNQDSGSNNSGVRCSRICTILFQWFDDNENGSFDGGHSNKLVPVPITIIDNSIGLFFQC
mmetsp:Transcript_22609/g.25927  ORF Transcript_22609/g.25927 Transcript_22609/m.25927 type:complete len:82 (-) Transcript_22609:31-276(-)